jgi:hypothetical protein
LDEAGRAEQQILMLADGSFDVLELWRGLPERVILVTRTARNRCLYYLPKADSQPGPGRPALYGERAPHPADWLHAGLRNWPSQFVGVRGKQIKMRYQVLGPFVREGLPERPLFLIVVKGMHRPDIHQSLRIEIQDGAAPVADGLERFTRVMAGDQQQSRSNLRTQVTTRWTYIF